MCFCGGRLRSLGQWRLQCFFSGLELLIGEADPAELLGKEGFIFGVVHVQDIELSNAFRGVRNVGDFWRNHFRFGRKGRRDRGLLFGWTGLLVDQCDFIAGFSGDRTKKIDGP